LPGISFFLCCFVAINAASVFFPISIPANIICYSTGLLQQKDFRIGGIVVGILGPLLAVLWALLLRG